MNMAEENRLNAEEYNRLANLLERGDYSVLNRMAECLIKSQRHRDLQAAIHFNPEVK